jgi:hypothetical protein
VASTALKLSKKQPVPHKHALNTLTLREASLHIRINYNKPSVHTGRVCFRIIGTAVCCYFRQSVFILFSKLLLRPLAQNKLCLPIFVADVLSIFRSTNN